MISGPKASLHDSPTTRAFIAIELPTEVKGMISGHVARLKRLIPHGVKWVDPQTAHLTLAFLGNVPDARLPTLCRILDSVASGSTPLRLKTGDPGTFPNPDRARVLWLGLDGDTQLLTLMQRRLQNALEIEGFPLERRAFNPHVTIGRVRGKGHVSLPAAPLHSLGENKPAFGVRKIVLMSSVLTSRGPISTRGCTALTFHLNSRPSSRLTMRRGNVR